MGRLLGSQQVGRGRPAVVRSIALLSPIVLLALAACGGDDSPGDTSSADAGETTTTTVAGPLPCAEDRHLAAFDVIGFLTEENVELVGPWVNDGQGPTPRAGTVEVAQTLRQQGYELLYITTLPPDVVLDGLPVGDAIVQWLQASGYPFDAGTHVWVWDGLEGTSPWISITDELLRFNAEGVSIDVGFSENMDKLYAMSTGGVPAERLYALNVPEAAQSENSPSSAPTTTIPNNDVLGLVPSIQQFGPACQVG